MTLLNTVINKASSTASSTLHRFAPEIDRVKAKISAKVPIHLQIRGAHLFQKIKMRVIKKKPFPDFIEKPIPDVYTLKIEEIDLSNPFLFRQNQWRSYYKRLRDECPVHYQKNSPFGPFWSITRYEDILFVDKHHELFSAEPVIAIGAPPEGLAVEMFIAMDPPKHDLQRQAVQGVVAPKNLLEMEGLIRGRVQEVLDNLPVGKPFDWVQTVSVELTARMLATLLDFPYEKRHKLVYWSDLAAGSTETTGGTSEMDETFLGVADMAKHFSQLWREKEAKKAAGEPLGYA
jgi:cytochrome P450